MTSDKESSAPNSAPDRQFEIMRRFVPYQFGSLWWGRDDLIHSAQPEFVERKDRIGHPLLSIKRDGLNDRMDIVPMLVGTSGRHLRKETKLQCVSVRGLTAEDPDHVSYFGSIVEPGLYEFDDLLDGVVRKDNSCRRPSKWDGGASLASSEPRPWFEVRSMHPNAHKPRVDDREKADLEQYCQKHGF